MENLFKPDHEPPHQEPGDGDGLYRLAEAAAELIPAGGAVFRHIVTSPAERRLEEWRQDVGEKLRELSAHRGVDIEALRDDPQFLDAVLAATQAAMKTSRAEKLEALRNATLNAAMPDRPDEAAQHLFIQMIDRFSTWHLRLLKLFSDPPSYLRAHRVSYEPAAVAGSLSNVVEMAFPELRGQRDLYDRVWSDLHANGLTGTPDLHTMMSGGGTIQKRTTAFGDSFLRFIEEPH